MGRQADAIRQNLETLIGGAAKALTLEVTANLIRDCPVKTGHARRNFVPSVGEPHEGEDDGQAQRTGEAEVLQYRIGDGPLHVANNVPYMGRLILGSSDQAAPGWDLVAVDQAVATVQELYSVTIDVTSSADVSSRGARAAEGLAGAFSPFGEE